MGKDESYPVFRGGGWGYYPAGSRVAGRVWYEPSYRFNDLGLRLARLVSPLERLSEAVEEVSHGAEIERA